MKPASSTTQILNSAVIVGALGYFVDIYDLLLFSIVRVPSLNSMGLSGDALLSVGVHLLNMQMMGLLLGGILWGIVGDKRGRVSVLFGSIALYSVANILNGFAQSVQAYGWLRFTAGVGLAGELGAAITLVSEVMSKETRGYGTTVVAGVGLCGAIFAALIGDFFDWRAAFVVGGVLGLGLLVLRMKTIESGMFDSMKSDHSVRRGDFLSLFKSWARFKKYAGCILIGVPIWFVIGILVTFAPELATALSITGPIDGGRAIMVCYMGLAVGDITSGVVSQKLKSRKKSITVFLGLTGVLIALYLDAATGWSPIQFYLLCVALGFAVGYWAVFVTNASEQFGTNLRATVATTTPNFVRGAVVPLTLGFQSLKHHGVGLLPAAGVVGAVALALAFGALSKMEETFGKELHYIEP